MFKRRWKGKGKEYYKNEIVFEGEYLNGRRWDGYGKEYNNFGHLVFEGKYNKGEKIVGKVKEFDDGKIVNEKENKKEK